MNYINYILHQIIRTKHFFLIFPIIVIFTLCTKTPKETESTRPKISIALDTTAFNQKFFEIEKEKKIDWLVQWFRGHFKNNIDVDVWLENKIDLNVNSIEQIEPTKIKKLVDFHLRLQDQGYPRSSYRLSRVLLHYHKDKIQSKDRIELFGSMANYYSSIRERDSLTYYVNLLKKEFLFNPSQNHALYFYSNNASLAEMNGNFFEAIVSYKKALFIASENNIRNKSIILQNIATLYLNMGYYDRAKEYILRSTQLLDGANYPVVMYNTLGIIHYHNNELEAAESTFNQIIDISTQQGNLFVLAQSHANFANVKRKKGEFEASLFHNLISDSICVSLGLDIGLLINQINRAHIYLEQGKPDIAKQEMVNAAELLHYFKQPKIFQDYYELYYKIEDTLGNYVLANEYYRKYKEMHEKAIDDLPASIISEWELSDEREKRIKESTRVSILLEQQKTQKYFIAFVLALTLFLSSIIIYFIRRKILKEKKQFQIQQLKLQHELELKSQELIADSMQKMNIEQIKESISENLSVLIQTIPKTHQHKLEDFAQKMRSQKTVNHLEEFELRFKSLNASFYDHILEIAPDMTPNELRVCAFIRLNISTKDMAALTNRTVGTIENIRINIRKKLNLDKGTNLQAFLSNIS